MYAGLIADTVLWTLLAGSIFWGWLNFKNSSAAGFSDRLTISLVPLAIIVILGLLVRQALLAPFWDRNASRLVGIFSLKFGYKLYCEWGQGALQSMNYPPLAALSFFPLLPFKSPTPALVCGDLLNAVFFFAPALLILSAESKRGGFLAQAVPLLAVFFFLTYESSPLKYSAFRIHADAPALGFSAFAAYFLAKSFRSCTLRNLFLSSLFCVAAVWTKQNMLPLVMALPLAILIGKGNRVFWKFLGCLGAVLALAVVITLTAFPYRALITNIFFLGKKPWTGPFGDVMVLEFVRLMQESIWFVAITVLIFSQKLFQGRESKTDAKTFIRNNNWLLFPFIGMAMIPVCLITRGKVGGDVNSFSPAVYFFALGAVSSLGAIASEGKKEDKKSLGRVLTPALLVMFIITHGIPLSYFGFSSNISQMSENPQETAYRYAKAHPGETYFPWNPLSNLLAEGKLYHFEPAIIDWYLAGRPISRDFYESFTPRNPSLIAFHQANEFNHKLTRQFYPSYLDAKLNDLPHWAVLIPPKIRPRFQRVK